MSKTSGHRRYRVSITPTHWVPFDERISASTESDTLREAEWIYNSYVASAPHDDVTYEIELDELDRESGEVTRVRAVTVENGIRS